MSDTRPAIIVDFFADLSCPWCYVGWESLKAAAASRRDTASFSLAWRTFMLSPDAPPEGYDRKDYLAARLDPARLRAANEALKAAANAAGAELNIDAATRIPSTVNAHRVVHWAASYGLAEAMIDTLFRANFVDGLDIGDTNVLVAAAESKGLDPNEVRTRLATDEDKKLIRDFHIAAARLGIQGVPVAIFNRKHPVMGAESVEGYARAIDAALA
ncbi:MAG: DsbA family oxidoreductase [Terricaulis sp.]